MINSEREMWVQPPAELNLTVPYVRGKELAVSKEGKMDIQIHTERGMVMMTADPKKCYDLSEQEAEEDMCNLKVLNEPEILKNIVSRFEKGDIFTWIGPILISVNPYKKIERLFKEDVLQSISEMVMNKKVQNCKPHVYTLAAKAYTEMRESDFNQSIVISGQSGAGKTESTKYCMQLLISLNNQELNEIQFKILACNPILEAFGNSKTIKNQNSSRFGKYVQIYFDEKNQIRGANILSYLLEKSRVVEISKNQRSFHAFYALACSGIDDTKEPQFYNLLKQSGCYTAAGINDKQNFNKINSSFEKMGFCKKEVQKIWLLINSILKIGNFDFDDLEHQKNEAKPCKIIGKNLKQVAENLNISEKTLEGILLFEKRKMVKQCTFSTLNKNSCRANRNNLCKTIYSAVFDYILEKIRFILNPSGYKKFKEINILDIFGFQNFQENSFEQFCINYTNQVLLKLYNKHIFDREMEILKEDGLQDQIQGILPPSNQKVISIISGKMSCFSIINDLTITKQFNDKDIIEGFKKIKVEEELLAFDKIDKNKFSICHSQCCVDYCVQGFKVKNQDKVSEEIMEIVEKLFNTKKVDKKDKTILIKFDKEIEGLMGKLKESTVHFIRCIKSNQKKIPNYPDLRNILTQIRYLGVFQTTKIRKNAYPIRKLYTQFQKQYRLIFPKIGQKNCRNFTVSAIQKFNTNSETPLFGNKRVYISQIFSKKLNDQTAKVIKFRNQMISKIQRQLKICMLRKKVKKYLSLFKKRLLIFKKLPQFVEKYYKKSAFRRLNNFFVILNKQKNLQRTSVNLIGILKRINQRLIKQKQKKIFFFLKKPQIMENKQVKKIKPEIDTSHEVNFLQDLMKSSIVESSAIDHEAYRKPFTPSSEKMGKSFAFGEQFLKAVNLDSPRTPKIKNHEREGILFYKNYQLQNVASQGESSFEKLRLILGQKYLSKIDETEDGTFSPQSEDSSFKIEDTQIQTLNKIIQFPIQSFYTSNLRKRTNFLGSKKSYKEILVYKNSSLSRSMTVISDQSQQKKAISLFNILLKIGCQEKIDNVVGMIQDFMNVCQKSSNTLRNEAMVQLIRQSNTEKELTLVRIYQTISVFLHSFTLSQDFIMSFLHIQFMKHNDMKMKVAEEQFVRYTFRKALRKISRRFSLGYLPIHYQTMALMCKRQISIPIYLPRGNSIIIKVESYHTFFDIKQKTLAEFGINTNRIQAELFNFHEIVNFQNVEIEETPIKESNIVWDMMTYWEITKEKYEESGVTPPSFFLMLKVRFAFECFEDDEEAIQICFAQCYFDYFMGTILFQIQQMIVLAALLKTIKYGQQTVEEVVMGILPLWMAKKLKKQGKIGQIILKIKEIKIDLGQVQSKYRFLQICEKNPIAMSMNIPTEDQIKFFMKIRQIFIVKNDEIIESVELNQIVKWTMDKEKFSFDAYVEKKLKSFQIKTEYSSMCNQFLTQMSKLKVNQQVKQKDFKKKIDKR